MPFQWTPIHWSPAAFISAAHVITRHDRVLPLAYRGQPVDGNGFEPARGQANDGEYAPLRTPIRRAIITVAVRRPRLTVQTNAFLLRQYGARVVQVEHQWHMAVVCSRGNEG